MHEDWRWEWWHNYVTVYVVNTYMITIKGEKKHYFIIPCLYLLSPNILYRYLQVYRAWNQLTLLMVTLTVRHQTRSSIKVLNVVVKILPLITKQIQLYYTCQKPRGNTRESYQHISYFIYFYTFTKIDLKL